PIVHVVLLEGAGRAETAHAGETERLPDLAGRRLVDEYPRPHLGLAGAARLPNAEGPRGAAQQREIREDGGDDRVDQRGARPEPPVDLGADLALVGLDLGQWRVAVLVGGDADHNMAVAGRN